MTMSTTVSRPVTTAARHVRATVAVVLVGTTIALLALLAFGQVGGLRTSPEPASDLHAAVQAELERLESTGLECSTRPALVDVVVLEHDDGSVTRRSFADAVTLVSADDATARVYCR